MRAHFDALGWPVFLLVKDTLSPVGDNRVLYSLRIILKIPDYFETWLRTHEGEGSSKVWYLDLEPPRDGVEGPYRCFGMANFYIG